MTDGVQHWFVFCSNVVHGAYYLGGTYCKDGETPGIRMHFRNILIQKCIVHICFSIPACFSLLKPQIRWRFSGQNKFWKKKKLKETRQKENWAIEGLICLVHSLNSLWLRNIRCEGKSKQRAEVLIKAVCRAFELHHQHHIQALHTIFGRCFSEAGIEAFSQRK